MPPEADRADIFRVHTRGRPVGRGVDPAYLAGLTEGLSGSDIAAACRSAAMMAITACIGDGCDPKGPEEVLITQEIFEEAIKRAAVRSPATAVNSGEAGHVEGRKEEACLRGHRRPDTEAHRERQAEAGRPVARGEGAFRDVQGVEAYRPGGHPFPGDDEPCGQATGKRHLRHRVERRGDSRAARRVLVQEKDSLLDVFAVREIIEPEIARLAAKNAKPEQVADLLRIVEAQERELAKGSNMSNTRFHRVLAKMSRNKVMERLLFALLGILAEAGEKYAQTEERRQKSLHGHRQVLAAIQEGSQEAAGQAMRRHLSGVQDVLFKKAREASGNKKANNVKSV